MTYLIMIGDKASTPIFVANSRRFVVRSRSAGLNERTAVPAWPHAFGRLGRKRRCENDDDVRLIGQENLHIPTTASSAKIGSSRPAVSLR